MIKLHDFTLSGHAHRVRLMLSLLDLPYEKITVNLAKGEHKKAPFTDLNPFGLVPVLEDGDLVIRDSIAIITYLANKYAPKWYPQDNPSFARIQEWLALAAKELAEGPARARLIVLFGAKYDAESTIAYSHKLLAQINELIGESNWLVGESPSIADVACYTYIKHAPDGNVALDDYTNILRWLSNVEALDNFEALK